MDQQHQEKHGGLILPAFGYAAAGDFSASGMQSYEPAAHDLIGLQAGMELLGIPSKHHNQSHHHHHQQQQQPDAWREYFAKGGGGTAAGGGAGYPQAENFMVVDDSSLRCLFPADGNEQQQQQQQPNQGLSLSLYNPNPSGLQQTFHHQQDGRFFPAAASPPQMMYQHPQQQLRSSKYLIPAQELLGEFCCLRGSNDGGTSKHSKNNKNNKWEEGGSSSSSSWSQSLYSMDPLELQKRKSRLLAMLEEVDRRYRKYCEQMKAVVSAFESVAGDGAATVYSSLASKAMSRHFRCLRDGIVGQIQETKKAMGEKDPAVPGSTKGETPRLRVLDQCIRQQKQFQQAGMVENHPWRPQRGLPERSVSVLRAWLFEHFLHPYPSDVDKHILARQTGLSRSQVSNWFINARVRLWKPMVEEMYMEETKEQDNQSSNATAGNEDGNSNNNNASSSSHHSQLHRNEILNPSPNPSSSQLQDEDQKPHLLTDSESLASIISGGHHLHGKNPQYQQARQQQVSRAENFGMVDMDFPSFGNQNFGGGTGGVSLTLGLQQHNGGGMSLSFSPTSQQSLFFSRENMDDCQPVQFSILDGDQAQSVPYRNLMGAQQFLHDLTG